MGREARANEDREAASFWAFRERCSLSHYRWFGILPAVFWLSGVKAPWILPEGRTMNRCPIHGCEITTGGCPQCWSKTIAIPAQVPQPSIGEVSPPVPYVREDLLDLICALHKRATQYEKQLTIVQGRCTELLEEARALRARLAHFEAMDGLLLPGWLCPHCKAFVGEAKQRRDECRVCGAARPEHPGIVPRTNQTLSLLSAGDER